MSYPVRNKYNARKCVSTDGITFDSKKECYRWEQLRSMQKKGEISNLERQRKFELIPNQKGPDGKVAERAINYVADFVYYKNGEMVVEDVKGYRDPQSAGYAKFVIKRKLMRWIHHIVIKEV